MPALVLTLLFATLLLACASPQPSGRIAFSSDRDGNADIYTINADGTGLERLTHGPSSDTNPVWSPDGQHIAFNYEAQCNLDVCVMHADDSPAINLTDSTGAGGSSRWIVLLSSWRYETSLPHRSFREPT